MSVDVARILWDHSEWFVNCLLEETVHADIFAEKCVEVSAVKFSGQVSMGQVPFSIRNSLGLLSSLAFRDLLIDPCLLERVIWVKLRWNLYFALGFLLWSRLWFCGWYIYRFSNLSDLLVGNPLKVILSDKVDQVGFRDVSFGTTGCHLLRLDSIIQKVEPGGWRHFRCCFSCKHPSLDNRNHFLVIIIKLVRKC